MITTTQRQPARHKQIMSTIRAARTLQAIRWPFTHRYAAPIWLALRLYLGWIWLQFSIGKFQGGWLTSDPIGGMLTSIAKGILPVPLPFYRGIAAALLDMGLSPLISHAMPFLELAVALAFFSGVLVGPAAAGAILLNANFILSGIAVPAFDGRIIVLQVVLILAWRVAGLIGVEKLLVKGFRELRRERRFRNETYKECANTGTTTD
jgi:thiosulfate dehydrogenase (quinone) large subunit